MLGRWGTIAGLGTELMLLVVIIAFEHLDNLCVWPFLLAVKGDGIGKDMLGLLLLGLDKSHYRSLLALLLGPSIVIVIIILLWRGLQRHLLLTWLEISSLSDLLRVPVEILRLGGVDSKHGPEEEAELRLG